MPKRTSPNDIADALPGIMGRARGARAGARLEVLALRAYLEAIERHIPHQVEGRGDEPHELLDWTGAGRRKSG